jgi:ornithine--oxo-acid transaminase
MAPSASISINASETRPTKTGRAVLESAHAASTDQAVHYEHQYAAHNYHPLPVVFAKGKGVHVWDPEVCSHAHGTIP